MAFPGFEKRVDRANGAIDVLVSLDWPAAREQGGAKCPQGFADPHHRSAPRKKPALGREKTSKKRCGVFWPADN
jgi:hypothetical protein